MPKSRDCSLNALSRRDILQCLAPASENQQRKVVFFGKNRLRQLNRYRCLEVTQSRYGC